MTPDVVAHINNAIPPELVTLGLILTALSGTFYFVWGFVGPVVAWLRRQLYQLSYRQIEIYVADEDYAKFNMWLDVNKQHTHFQRMFNVVKPTNTSSETETGVESRLVAGFGTVLIKAPNLPLISVTRRRVETKQVYEQTERLILRIFSFRETAVQQVFDQISSMKVDEGPFIYSPNSWGWDKAGKPKKVLPPISSASNEFIDDVETFLDSESEYNSRGIAYKRGYLLYGEPGTGKSSDIAYIANKFNMNIYQLNSEGITKFTNISQYMHGRSIVLIEDVDMTVAGAESRTNIIGDQYEEVDNNSKDTNITKVLSREAMREFLNTLDGISEFAGSIVVLTTNKPSDLDGALLRPGRIDKQIRIGPYTPCEQIEHINRFFNSDLDPSLYPDITGRTVADLQFLCIQHMHDLDKLIEQL